MRTVFSWALTVAVAVVPVGVIAQQGQPPRTGEGEGFFRPAPDPAINIPIPSQVARPQAQPLPPAAAPDLVDAAAQATATEVMERQLDRAEREHDRARAEALRQPSPMIASPLDGTAPIGSPLDGTAPIVSPLGR